MKTFLKMIDFDKYQLEIHSENDVESIALKAWSDRYFDINDIKDKGAILLIVHTTVKENEGT